MIEWFIEWLIRRWKNVRGNAEFAIMLLVGSVIVTGITKVTHGLNGWQQMIIVGCFVIMFGWAVIPSWILHKNRNAPTGAGSVLSQLTTVDCCFESTGDDDTTTRYRKKARIVIINSMADDLIVGCPTWTTGTLDVQIPEQVRLQLEEKRGGWKSSWWEVDSKRDAIERTEAHVKPGGAFRVWIGLGPSVDRAELRRKHEIRQVGMFTFPVKIHGRNFKVEVLI